MTDPLTKEERKIVDRVRHRIREDEAWGDCDTDASELLAIIDNLSKRGVKKYSLTKEQRETVERAKTLLADKWNYGVGEWVGVAEILMDIIGNLSKRGVKKYAIESLQDHPEYGDGLKYVPDYRQGFIDALRYLGALE
jgi:hypothetical protein